MLEQQELEGIVHLARVAMNAEELAELRKDLEKIVKFVEHLNEVNVEGVQPMSHSIPHHMQWRKDEPMPVVGRLGVSGSVGYEEGLVRVPRIIE